MESFAEYILNENNYFKKIEIAYYLHKKANEKHTKKDQSEFFI